jgi:hypothetical protein
MNAESELRYRRRTTRDLRPRSTVAADAHARNGIAVPPLIRRNTLLLAATQAFVGTGTQLVPTLGGIMIERLLGSLALAGLGTSLLYFARLLVAYPIGWMMDTYGRKVGLLMGLTLNLIGAVGVGLAMLWSSFPVFVAAMLVFGLGVGAGQQLRTAAADMYLPERRAEGLGYVLSGALLGALGGPLLIAAAQTGAAPLGLDSTALAWLLVPVVLIPSMALVFLIKPDPKAIAADLVRFYPGYQAPLAVEQDILLASGAGLRAWLAHYPLRVAFLAMFAAPRDHDHDDGAHAAGDGPRRVHADADLARGGVARGRHVRIVTAARPVGGPDRSPQRDPRRPGYRRFRSRTGAAHR